MGETISVNVHIQNNSNKAVKKIKESEDGFPLGSGSTLSKVYELKPLLSNNKDKWGLALDGQLKHEDTNLASSTLIHDPTQKENLGIIVQYKVKVKLYLGPLAGELAAELPFTLMHPKPEPEPERKSSISEKKSSSPNHNTDGETSNLVSDVPVDTNLIQLDTDDLATNTNTYADNDDDIIFEVFFGAPYGLDLSCLFLGFCATAIERGD